jgi:hypothetical protein
MEPTRWRGHLVPVLSFTQRGELTLVDLEAALCSPASRSTRRLHQAQAHLCTRSKRIDERSSAHSACVGDLCCDKRETEIERCDANFAIASPPAIVSLRLL